MVDSHTQLPSIHLRPGELYIGAKPVLVTTILGSCISATFFDGLQGLGSICHALLPTGRSEGDGFRHVDYSLLWMLEEFIAAGAKRSQIEVKLFGGSDMFNYNGAGISIGQQNIQTAISIIKAEGLRLVASSVGGSLGRKIVFFPHTGEVLLRYGKN